MQIRIKDALGNPVAVKDFKAINKRTGKSTAQDNDSISFGNQGNYTVASDADVRELSETGDSITVTAVHPQTNKKLSADFVISGGKCACHINKVSGPVELTL